MFNFLGTIDPNTTMTNIGLWSDVLFQNFLGIIVLTTGLLLGGMFISFIIGVVIGSVNTFINSRNADKYD